MIPLSMVKDNEVVKVRRISGGNGIVSKLARIGIREGQTLRVINNTYGPVLISIGNSRIGLGRGISFKILVERIKEARDGT